MSARVESTSPRDPGALVRTLLILLAVGYVGILVLAPLGGIVWATARAGWSNVSTTLNQPDVRHAYWLTGVITLITVVVTTAFGVLTAWVLARHHFRGRGLLNAVVDLPMAVSPVIVGLMCVLLFGRGGWFEPFFASRGIQVIFALPAMILVTIFICIPFVIREVVPVLHEIGVDEEEAAKTLGASSLQTFVRVTLPSIRWGLMYGVALSTARALGEIGAVLIVSGAIQGQTETATLYIFRAFEERQEPSAYLVALSLAAISIFLLVTIETLKKHKARR
ncbi:MAG TPA: sulfate ABC transporter permease subunit [Actinomycetota bacterium]|nr:sulfate ABC transporter permease subunit [Actinomycetota bacterium]